MNKLQSFVVITFTYLSKLAFMVIVLITAGCASKPLSITESYNAITLESENIKTNATYKLYDKALNTTYTARGENGKVEFSLPAGQQSECLQLTPGIDRSLFGNPVERVQINLPREYTEASERYQQYLVQNRQKRSQYDAKVRAVQYTKSSLREHIAFINGRCRLPRQGAIPPLPKTDCDNRARCKALGASICYGLHIDSWAMLKWKSPCSWAADSQDLPYLKDDRECLSIAKKMEAIQKESNDKRNALIASRIGGLISFTVRRLAGISYFFFAGIDDLTSASQCTESFIETNMEPIETWRQTKRDIENQPAALRQQCFNLSALIEERTADANTSLKQLKEAQNITEKQRRALKLLQAKKISRTINGPELFQTAASKREEMIKAKANRSCHEIDELGPSEIAACQIDTEMGMGNTTPSSPNWLSAIKKCF